MNVKVKTHAGSRIKSIENSIIRLAEENSDYFKNVDAIILQVGANNVLDAELSETITDDLRDSVEVIKKCQS